MATASALNLLILAVVFESGLGRRRITTFRILRPFLAAGAIAPSFVTSLARGRE